jgi:ligand-binding SRPBCC domain-containing protein
MRTYELHRRQWVARPIDEVFDFFARAENLEQLTPDFLRFQIMRIPPRMEAGARIEYKIRIHGLPVRWRTIIEKWNPPLEFVDIQEKGPYRLWHHTHRMKPVNGGTEIEDLVRYALPFGPLGSVVHRFMVARDVAVIFDYRAQKIRERFP